MERAPETKEHVGARPRRPLYLTISLLLVWLMGLMGATDGIASVDVLRDPHAARSVVERTLDPKVQLLREATIHAVLAARHVAAPLAAANLILSSLLAIAAGRALFGRNRGHKLLFQAVVAYAVYLPIAYVVGRPIRENILAALTDPQSLGITVDGLATAELALSADILPWWWRIVLGFQLVAVAAVIFVLTRPRVRELLGGVGTSDIQPEGQ